MTNQTKRCARGLAAAFLGALTWAAFAGAAGAVAIDPGVDGETFTSRDYSFSALDGQATDGSTVMLDFVFSPKHLTVQPGSFSASIAVVYSGSNFTPLATPVLSSFLSDENGNNILSHSPPAFSFGFGTNISYIFSFDVAGPDPLTFHDIHFTIGLPTGSETIQSARLSLNGDGFTVGTTQLPEPATIALFGYGLLGLGLIVLRRKRA